MRFQARTTLSLNSLDPPRVMEVWSVEELPETHEVASLVYAGLLVPEDENGAFPDPEPPPRRCCGG